MGVGDVAFSLKDLLGQTGGALALAYGAGAASGWAFAIRTAFRAVKKQVEDQRDNHKTQIERLTDECRRDKEECERRIAHLEAWVKEQGDRYTSGLERQLTQARQSAESMTGRIDRGRLTPIDE